MLSRKLLPFLAVVLTSPAFAAEPPISFNRDVRPILSDTCFRCHGPDARVRKAELRLDTKEGLAAVTAGKGEFLHRITSAKADEVMPPPKSEKKLTAKQIETLKAWVAQGAKYEGHWAYEPIARPKPVAAGHPVDGFVRAELAAAGLKPGAEADRVTLARRLSFDLTGLPPTPEMVEEFVRDNSPNAVEKLVDRLLASPHYGERMAMFWLDLVRYADSVGYHGDQPVSVSYRDWVIKAFNENMRFDRFTLEQLAGDLLPNATIEQKVAAGYNRLGMMSAEGGVQPKEYLAKYAAERVRNLSGAWLGVTIGCAECHDHKFDPFSTKDFYRLEAFFTDFQERGIYDGGNFGPSMPVPTAKQMEQVAVIEARIATLKKVLDTPTAELVKAQIEWEKNLPKPVEWTALKPTAATSGQGAKLTVQPDGSILASGKNPPTDTYTITLKAAPGKITAIRLEALPHPTLPTKGPGRASNGNFVVTEFHLSVTQKAGKPEEVALQNGSASFEQIYTDAGKPGVFSAASAIDRKNTSKLRGWAIAGATGIAQQAVFETATDLTVDSDTPLTVELRQLLDNPTHTLGHFRISTTTSPRPVTAEKTAVNAEARAILAVPAEKRTAEQKEKLAAFYRTVAPALAKERADLATAEAEKAKLLASSPTTLITVGTSPRMIRVLPRGNWMDDTGAVVQPGFPDVLPKPAAGKERLTRLDLANWVTASDNPLTARALANRLWKQFFGAGLSRKLDDMGSQGEWPSHPQLLDFLAGKLIDSGWDIKALVKLIVTSESYRQSSVGTKDSTEKDPFNKWLSRQGRFRLDAEMVRDNALAVSGLLVNSVGGTSAKPYQPPGYWAYLNFPTREWQNDSGENLYRRGLYTHWQRQYLHPSLAAFDAPSREECTAERVRSNTPLQALVLLNDPIYVEAARAFAERSLAAKSDSERIDWMFRQALSRPAKDAEKAVVFELLAKHRADFKKDPAAAQALLKVGVKPMVKDADAVELASWTNVARTILNLHSVITRN